MKISYTSLIASICILFLFGPGCTKQESLLPEIETPAPLSEQQQLLMNTLVAAPDGWYISYKPTEQSEDISILMHFKEDRTLTLLAGYPEFHEEQKDAKYDFGGVITPELIFSQNSVWGELATAFNGALKFKIVPQGDGSFLLKRADGYDNKVFVLKKATQENKATLNAQITKILEKIEFEREQQRLRQLAAFKLATLGADDCGFYFKNFSFDNFSAYWQTLDTVAKTISLKWKGTGTVETTTEFTYTIIPDGIALNPVLRSGSNVIDTIRFGNYIDHKLEILSAGNVGTGKLGWMHIPAYPYQNAIAGAAATYTTSDLFIRSNELPRFLGYTMDEMDIYYSGAFQAAINELKAYFNANGFRANELFRLQFYNNNTSTGATHETRNTLQFLVRNSAGTSTFLPYHYNLQRKGPNEVSMVSYHTAYGSAAPAHQQKAYEFMDKYFTADGFTVVPTGRNGTSATALQKLRLVSRKDSRIWMEILVSTPTGIYFN